MCVSVCVCVRACVRAGVCVRVRACVCVRTCLRRVMLNIMSVVVFRYYACGHVG